ncbi:2Fe-2S iron-sulfur cluster-binding protein [Hydrogenobacter sp. T-2]|uniref:succinate dehydrogenase/fumarate reductase iron-sulfur subunit n=1 Tax=Pampinifervens diazotrophicum TaxID=1632018 RepID=UPI002B25CB8E|nr:2Fe-2S iron-sulfur cluster-binding protein [Hydrogenobacter sp. T-2]WPM31838.1 2Fe-2S iron-sulfur cluster-binding protein [Hydrogenobacter sp. T-2]
MKVRIKRHPKGVEEFEVEVSQKITLLELLYKVKEELDPTLAFRSMCRAGICGTCAVKLNGKPVLACSTWVSGEDILVEPIDRFSVIKDLVVENESMEKKLKVAKIWLRVGKEGISLHEEVNRKTSRSWDCILCGVCDSVCPVLSESELFGGPLSLTRLYKYLHDPRNMDYEATLKTLQNLKPELCTHCMNCSYACPKRLMPEGLIREEENLLVEKGLLQRQVGGFDFLSF